MDRIEHPLIVGIGMDGGHQPFAYPKAFVKDFNYGSDAVGGAGGIGDDAMLCRVIFPLVYAEDDGNVLLFRWRCDEHLLGPTLEVPGGFGCRGEQARRLHDYLDAEIAPANLGRVALSYDLDLLAVDDDRVLGSFHLARVATVDTVILKQMGVGLGIRQVVDHHNLKPICVLVIHRL